MEEELPSISQPSARLHQGKEKVASEAEGLDEGQVFI